MTVLLHICCAVCLGGPLEALREEGHDIRGLFYNPNIHPLLEFCRRLKALRVFQESDPIEIEYDERYGLDVFLVHVYQPWHSKSRGAALSERPPAGRCRRCYDLRLARTARVAR